MAEDHILGKRHVPSVLVAGKTTNFRFSVEGLSGGDIEEINAIKSSSKVMDRLNAISDRGASIRFESVANPIFEKNMLFIDSQFPRLMAECLLVYYEGHVSSCEEVVEILESRNPLGFTAEGMYCFKLKKFLAAAALGMVPSRPWSGRDEITGEYIVATGSNDTVAFNIYSRDNFEDYLLENTRFETASTNRHEFGSLYEEDGRTKMNLNLQIRFKK